MTTIPTLREALEKLPAVWRLEALGGGNGWQAKGARRAWQGAAKHLESVLAEHRPAAVDQAVEALAGPEAGEAKALIEESSKILHRVRTSSTTILEGLTAYEAAGMIERLAKALAGFSAASIPQPEPAAGGWRDIASAPKDGTMILVAAQQFDWFVNQLAVWTEAGWRYPGSKDEGMRNPTHWRPIAAASPSPPGLDEAGVEAATEAFRRSTTVSDPEQTAVAIITAYLEATHGR